SGAGRQAPLAEESLHVAKKALRLDERDADGALRIDELHGGHSLPLVSRSFGAPHEPGGIRSLSPSATLRGAATPPWTPSLSTRGPLLSERPTSQRGPSVGFLPLSLVGPRPPPGAPSPCVVFRRPIYP